MSTPQCREWVDGHRCRCPEGHDGPHGAGPIDSANRAAREYAERLANERAAEELEAMARQIEARVKLLIKENCAHCEWTNDAAMAECGGLDEIRDVANARARELRARNREVKP